MSPYAAGIFPGMEDRTGALRALLESREWEAADRETRRLLVAAGDVGGYAGVDADEAGELDCDLLQSIDAAWTEASDGRFGFSAQRRTLADVMAEELPMNETWREFGREVGWVQGREWIDPEQVSYRSDAPQGHLPYVPGFGTVVNTGRIYEGFMYFYDRLGRCAEE